MHPKHRILLKKNAKRIVHTGNDQSVRAFYFALDKSRSKDSQEVLHIDRKIKQPGKFNNVKKLNRTLEPFNDKDYQLNQKTRMCAGIVNRSEDGALMFSVQVKKGIGAGQLARSLKKFKKLIGKAGVLKGNEGSDESSEELLSAGQYRSQLEALLGEYNTSRQKGEGITGDDEGLRAHSLSEEGLVDRCIQAIGKLLEAVRAEKGDNEDAANQAEADQLAATLVGQTVAQWQATLAAWKPWIDGGSTVEEDDLELAAAIAEELREANLDDSLTATREQAVNGVSYFLLQQQEMFRNSDTQLDPVLTADELSLSKDGVKLEMTPQLLKESGLGRAFTLVDGELRLKDSLMENGVISAKNRQKLAGLLVKATQLGFDLHMGNPSAGDDGAQIDLSAREDGTFTQLIDRRRVASGKNLMFDRRQDVVPGSEPPRTFSDVMGEMNHADDETFAKLNDMIKDAWKLDQAKGLVANDMSFRDYKMQFVDLEVGGVDESGLRWHDNTGSLGVEEWAFLALKVNDLPERTQNNYYVEISWKGCKKPIERKLDIACDFTKMKKLLDSGSMGAVLDWVYDGLADEEWSRSGLGVAPGDKAGLKKAYKGYPINVKMGFWNEKGSLVWDYKEGYRPALVNTMPGKDELVPLVNDIPEGALRTLLADEDGNMPQDGEGNPIDVTTEEGRKLATDNAVKSINDVVMETAMTSWTENSTEALGDLLKPIPDTQKVFLRQSNGTVNSVRITNTDVRGALDALGSVEELSDIAEKVRKLVMQPGVTSDNIQNISRQVRDIANKRNLDPETRKTVEAALKVLNETEPKDIGQVSVINDGNDTGAFGKCAPASYFCASLCGVSQAARGGFDALHEGGPELRKASQKLEQMLTSGAMTEERRKAIEEQIKEVERLVKDSEAQRDEAQEKLFTDPEWMKYEEEALEALNKTNDEVSALLEKRREIEDGQPELKKLADQLEVQRSQHANLKNERDRLQKKRDEIKKRYKSLNPVLNAREFFKLRGEMADLKDQIKEYDGLLKTSREAISETTGKLGELKEKTGEGELLLISEKLKELEKQQVDMRREFTQHREEEYNKRLGDVEAQLEARKQGLDKVKRLKESVVDRMVVKTDEDGPYMDMSFPVPKSAFDGSQGNYSGGWLIKKVREMAKETGKSEMDIMADLGCRQDDKGQWIIDVKVRPGDIQEYLEETNREDKYRGGKKHMMDFFKDPSSMNNIQLMKSLGPGLIAVGIDKGLKTMGKESGLLYGPSADVVATMVYNEQRTSEYGSLSRKMPDKYELDDEGNPKTDDEGNKIKSEDYKKELARRRSSILDKLKNSQKDGGSMSVSMGYSSDNGHVNYVQTWGTPSVDGVEISSDDVARCRMNLVENAASSSAWNNDRVQDFPINTAAMGRGLDGIIEKMRAAGKADSDPRLKELLALKQTADEATAALDAIASEISGGTLTGEQMAQMRSSGLQVYWRRSEEIAEELKKARAEELKNDGKSETEIEETLKAEADAISDKASDKAWNELDNKVRVAINRWDRVGDHPDYAAALDKIRIASADTSDWLKDKMSVKNTGESLNEENVLIMPSNTERDNRVTDTEDDVNNVGGGNIGSQKRGSANATDASYFVPVNALASGWDGEVTDDPDNPDGKKCTASRYNYSDDPRDQFVMLSSFTTMVSEQSRRR